MLGAEYYKSTRSNMAIWRHNTQSVKRCFTFYMLIFHNKWYDNLHSTFPSLLHYSDFIMSAMASQITSILIVYSTVCSGADQQKHQSYGSLAFMSFTGGRRIPRTKGQLRRKCFHSMTSSCDAEIAQLFEIVLRETLNRLSYAAAGSLGICTLSGRLPGIVWDQK